MMGPWTPDQLNANLRRLPPAAADTLRQSFEQSEGLEMERPEFDTWLASVAGPHHISVIFSLSVSHLPLDHLRYPS